MIAAPEAKALDERARTLTIALKPRMDDEMDFINSPQEFCQ
jgi:hypothetical protein